MRHITDGKHILNTLVFASREEKQDRLYRCAQNIGGFRNGGESSTQKLCAVCVRRMATKVDVGFRIVSLRVRYKTLGNILVIVELWRLQIYNSNKR